MNKFKVLLGSILLLNLVFSLTVAQSQNLFVKQKSGVFTAYPSSTVSKISFNNSEILITETNGTTNVSLSNFRYISFVDFFSSIPPINFGKKSLQLFPSTVKDNLSLEIGAQFEGNVLVRILSIDGKVINTWPMAIGETQLKINLTSLPNGVYLCKVNSNTYNETAKFIKNANL